MVLSGSAHRWNGGMRSYLRTVMLLALAAATLAGCQRVGDQRWGTPHVLRIGIVSDPSSLNPLFVTSQAGVDVGQLYTETLIGLSPNNELIPLAAQRVPTRANGGISSDGRTITYHLRRDERFADGQPLTSADVAFTYRAILDPRNPTTEAEPYRRIASLTTPDRYTVRIHLHQPWAAAVSELFAASDYAYGILPAHAFGSTDLRHAAWNERPYGSGPFRVASWQHGDEIVLVPNPYARRKPHVQRLTLKIVPDSNTLFMQVRTHAVDVAELTDADVPQARALTGVRVIETPQNHTDFLEFQTQRPPLNDVLVRRAISAAIDRGAIARTVYRGLYPSATTEIPPALWAHDAAIESQPFDPARAAAGLERAGWHLRGDERVKNGTALTLDFAFVGSNATAQRLATLVQAELRAAGVAVTLKAYPSTLFFAPAAAGGIDRGGRFNLAYDDWYGGADPEASELYTCDQRAPAGPNSERWCSAAYDRLFAEQARTTDRTARKRAFAGMQRLIGANAVADFLVYPAAFTALNPAVSGYTPNMLYAFGNSQDWDVR
ncbi:peptide ABC transporter substrate-binding protein [bacterium]|nr:MAG: peptide ABC transporter substrate-binding protein [bacterium]